jgi:hypothetical protein
MEYYLLRHIPVSDPVYLINLTNCPDMCCKFFWRDTGYIDTELCVPIGDKVFFLYSQPLPG